MSGREVPGDEIPVYFGRKSKTWLKMRADFCKDLATAMGKLPETQVDAVVPLLREDMQASLRTIRSLDARNRGRFREENNLAGMLRTLKAEELEEIHAVVAKGSVGSANAADERVEALALEWREALIRGDSEATTRVMGLAVEMVQAPGELQQLVRTAQADRSQAAFFAGAAEDADRETSPAESTSSEDDRDTQVLDEFTGILSRIKEVRLHKARRVKGKGGRKLLQALRPIAEHWLARKDPVE